MLQRIPAPGCLLTPLRAGARMPSMIEKKIEKLEQTASNFVEALKNLQGENQRLMEEIRKLKTERKNERPKSDEMQKKMDRLAFLEKEYRKLGSERTQIRSKVQGMLDHLEQTI